VAAICDHNILNGEGQEGQGGVFTVDADELASAFPALVEESGNNLGPLLMVQTHLHVHMVRAVRHWRMRVKTSIIYEDVHFAPLVWGLLLHLQLIWCSEVGNGSGCAIA